jgi:8-oxo-dGTP pyrophosphatase MutT (NUDIX family)
MADAATAPRAAATLLLLKDGPLRVLMITRHRAATFGSALVFPGGCVDSTDPADEWLGYVSGAASFSAEERALRIAGCRETYEETGILVCAQQSDVSVPLGPPEGFGATVRRAGCRLALDELHPVSRWLTPPISPQRFDTRFYLCRAPELQEACCDGQEAVAFEWLEPRAAIALADAKERLLLFPTRMNLLWLSRYTDAAGAIAAARQLVPRLIEPVVERTPRGLRLSIPEDARYGVTEFWPAESGGMTIEN